MHSVTLRATVVLVFGCIVLASIASAATFDHAHVPGELIVGFTASATPQQQASLHAALGAREIQDLGIARAFLVKFDPEASLADLQSQYFVEPARPIH
jgi:hypothetical protein